MELLINTMKTENDLPPMTPIAKVMYKYYTNQGRKFYPLGAYGDVLVLERGMSLDTAEVWEDMNEILEYAFCEITHSYPEKIMTVLKAESFGKADLLTIIKYMMTNY